MRSSMAGRLAVLFLTQLMLVVDTTIVNVALPRIGTQLGFSDAGLSWVVTVYALFFGGLILLSGKIGTLIGARRALLTGAAIFVVASAAGGLASTPGILIAARAFQGAGAALAAPSVLVLLTAITTPGPQRARAMALFVLATGSGAAAGLIIGGLLTEAFGWRSVMFVNVPVGVAILAGGFAFLTELPRTKQKLDVGGAVTSTLAMAAAVYGFTLMGDKGFAHPAVIAALTVAAVALAVLIAVERGNPDAVLPLSFFRSWHSSGPLLAMLVIPAGQVCYLYFTTLVTQQQLGYTPVQTGMILVPFTLALILANQLTPHLLSRHGERLIGSLGIAGLTAGIAAMAWAVSGPVTVTTLILPSVVLGLSAGLTFAPVTAMIMNRAPDGNTAAAASLLQGMQQLGGAIGLSVIIAGGHTYAGAFLATAAFPLIALALFTRGTRHSSPLTATAKGHS
ncbi:MFS transporter [Actinoplanes bogorensis]|uniref:MFS transporter n=1 Tax=Paractinoplanes bogorensis TaxID=1610840 RepID=A0ABS5YPY2_9ACTN|nr:MFS transporter [Actinoplanes bogorensis]MBU2665519.1 MFS transporter [Actinoplanes bogorensis]